MHIAIGITGCVVAVVAAFFLWASLHELSHYIAIKRYRSNAKGEFFLYPHRHEGRFLWARVSWEFEGVELSPTELAWVSFAPRWPDLVGVIGTTVLALALGWSWWALWLVILLGGSFFDLLIGSLGVNAESDLQRASRGWGISPWALRVPGLTLTLLLMTLTTYGLAAGV